MIFFESVVEMTELSKTRYQQGSIRRLRRKKGPDVWVFRWRNAQADGSRKETTRVIGTVLVYRTKAAAMKAAEALRININSTTPRPSVFGMTFAELADPYMAKELDGDQDETRKSKAHSTIEGNRRYLQRWIVTRWGSVTVSEMEPIVIEDWLRQLGREPYKLANGTRLKIRNIMSAVFRHGMRYGFLPRDAEANPLKYVRQSGRSTKVHTILTPEQTMAIIGYLQDPVRTMVLLDASTGLRASELTALRWEDVDFDAGVLHVRRGIVYAVVGESRPMPPEASSHLHRYWSNLSLPGERKLLTPVRVIGFSPVQGCAERNRSAGTLWFAGNCGSPGRRRELQDRWDRIRFAVPSRPG